ncbi:MAG TPA: hypothetical protein VHQ47_06855 [Phycisphaerae bacterium]|nr:hypothetical protein [Phycisphaerae bacterium]
MRRLMLWVAIFSFVVVAACSALFLIRRFAGGIGAGPDWTLYTAYGSSSSVSVQIMEVAMAVGFVALPVGLLAAAAYMALVERELQRVGGRGFGVLNPRQRGGA